MTNSFKLNLAPNARFSKQTGDKIGAMRKLVKLAPAPTLWQKLVAVWNYDTRELAQ